VSYEDRRRPAELIAADLRARIMSGELPAGSELSSTASLVEQYGVAVNTVRGAIETLKGEGLLIGAQGKAVFVRPRAAFVVDAADHVEPGRFSYRILDVRETRAPVEVAEVLGEDVVLRHRLMSHDGEPVELSWSYYAAGLVRGTDLAGRAKVRGGAPRVLAELGHPVRYVEDRVSVRPPTHDEAVALELPGGFPVIRQFRVGHSGDDRPVEVSVLVKGGHRFDLRYRVENRTHARQ
jgi:GntR family transcriptional regulator